MASGAIKYGSRAAVPEEEGGDAFLSPSDDEVGGLSSAIRAERAMASGAIKYRSCGAVVRRSEELRFSSRSDESKRRQKRDLRGAIKLEDIVNQPRLPLPEPGASKRQTRRSRPPRSSESPQPTAADSGPRVEVRRSSRRTRTVTAYRERDTIVVLIPQRMSKADEQTFVHDMVRKVLAREARALAPRGDKALIARAQELAATYLAPVVDHMPEPAGVLWVTNQQQRWGSCTPSTRMIRLSHRLQPMPAWVVDYVLVHELAHLVEPAHCDRFWELVGRYPAAEKAKGYLEGYVAGQGRRTDESEVD